MALHRRELHSSVRIFVVLFIEFYMESILLIYYYSLQVLQHSSYNVLPVIPKALNLLNKILLVARLIFESDLYEIPFLVQRQL